MKGLLLVLLHPGFLTLLICTHLLYTHTNSNEAQGLTAELPSVQRAWQPSDGQGVTYEVLAVMKGVAEPIGAEPTDEAIGDSRRLDRARSGRLQRLFGGGGGAVEDDDGGTGIVLGIVVPIVIAIICVIVWIIIAMMYKSRVTDKRPKFPQPVGQEWSMKEQGFKYSIFSCCQDMTYCLHGCCCWELRMADTYAATDVAPYWTVLTVSLIFFAIGYVCQAALGFVLRQIDDGEFSLGSLGGIGYYIPQVLFAWYMGVKRGILRIKLGGTPDCMMDFICWWWCGCCTAVQEARQVDEATSVRVECCCKLINLGSASTAVGVATVGGPVAIGQPMGQVVGEPVAVVAPAAGKEA